MSKTGNVRVISLSDTVGARALENASLARAVPPERHHRARAAALFSEVKNSFGKKRPCSDWLDCAYSATRRSGTWSSFLLQIAPLIIRSPPVLSANLRYAIERAPLYASSLLQLCRVSSALTFRYGACARARSGARRNFERTDGSLCNTFLKRELPSGVE